MANIDETNPAYVAFKSEVKALLRSPINSFEKWVKCPSCEHDVPESILKRHHSDCVKFTPLKAIVS